MSCQDGTAGADCAGAGHVDLRRSLMRYSDKPYRAAVSLQGHRLHVCQLAGQLVKPWALPRHRILLCELHKACSFATGSCVACLICCWLTCTQKALLRRDSRCTNAQG